MSWRGAVGEGQFKKCRRAAALQRPELVTQLDRDLPRMRAVDSEQPALALGRRTQSQYLEWIVHAGFGEGK